MTPDQAAAILTQEHDQQPVPLNAAGYRMTIHACGAATWVRADERGIFWCGLMTGDRHTCHGEPGPTDAERQRAAQKHERGRWVPEPKPAPVPAYGTFRL